MKALRGLLFFVSLPFCAGLAVRTEVLSRPQAASVPLAFEVASIKEAEPPVSVENSPVGQFHVGMNINGSRADYGFMSLADLIPYAYRVKRYQVLGPSWMSETRWDILARIPEGQPAARVPEMMQSLLTARFKLSIHRENREQTVYALVVGKGALKIVQATDDEEAASGAGGGLTVRSNDGKGATISGGAAGSMSLVPGPNGGMQMQMAKITMAALADRLAQFMDRPVVDATEFQGNYQVTLDLPMEAMMGMSFTQKLAAFAGLGSFGMASSGASDALGAAMIQAVKALGLDLQPRKAPIETIIVDRMEKTPTAN